MKNSRAQANQYFFYISHSQFPFEKSIHSPYQDELLISDSRSVSLLGFRSFVRYYNMALRNERWDLISECDPQKLGYLISFIFSDEYIFTHPALRKQLEADRKGYVNAFFIASQHILLEYFSENQIQADSQISLLQSVISCYCHQLIFRGSRIRRVVPFNTAVFRSIKPISIDKLEIHLTISDIRHHLGESAFSEIEQFRPDADMQFFYIYAPHYRERRGEKMPFRLLDYQKLCVERERESRYWDQQEKRLYVATTTAEVRLREHNQMRYKERKGDMKQEDEMMREQLRPIEEAPHNIFKPNPNLNQMLSSYIISMKERLDEE